MQHVGQVPKPKVLQSALARKVKHARPGPFCRRFLGDLTFRQVVVEIGNKHAEPIIGREKYRFS